jgi:hypothetical protein
MVLGVAWFSRTQWQRLTEVVEDRNELDDTFEQWERGALDAVRTIERQGKRVEKVYLDPHRPSPAALRPRAAGGLCGT